MRSVVLVALLALAPVARAAAAPPPPAWARSIAKTPDVERKVEGAFPDALPLVGYDTNTGLGLGVGAHLTFDGKRSDPLFSYTPYRHRLYAQAYLTTGGYQQHILSYDGVAPAGLPYRVKAVLTFERNTGANYFGNGEATLAPLSFHGQRFATYDDAVAAAGPSYYRYEYDRPQGQVMLERSLFGGVVRARYGWNVQYVAITRGDAPGAPTKLGLDCASGAATGCGGGWNDVLKGGFAFDTRDFEPDPNSGVFADVTGQWSAKAFGSSADYVRVTAAARAYVSPFPKLADLVVAGRVLYSVQSAKVPFFAMDTLAMAAGSDDATDQTGLGGERTLRGFRQDRFIGRVAAAANFEVRWTFAKFPLLAQRFSLQLAPFVDTGRVFDRVGFSLDDWKVAAGGGLRIGWNQSTIVMIDCGVSKEDVGVFVDFGMPF